MRDTGLDARLCGTGAATMTAAVAQLFVGFPPGPAFATIEVAGREVTRITDASAAGVDPRYAFASGDTVV